MPNVETYEIEGRAATRYALTNGAELILVPAYLASSEAAPLCAECERLPWEHRPIRGVPTRRANAWLADDPRVVYRYSGQVWAPRPMLEMLLGREVYAWGSEDQPGWFMHETLGPSKPDAHGAKPTHARRRSPKKGKPASPPGSTKTRKSPQ